MTSMIESIGLTKSFRDKKVIDSLDLKVEKGETLVIIGQSGCGKSVLLKHMIGLLKADSGQMLINGVDVATLKTKELDQLRLRFGMLFQASALFDSMSVGENVGFNLIEHSAMSEKQIYDKAEESLALVGLKGIQKLRPAELSGGMKKRVALARAICMRPEILLYDEPTTGLDPITADSINDLITRFHDDLKVTSVVVTHDMVSAYKIATRIAMMYRGKIISVGTPDEIRNCADPVVRQFITGSARGPITDVSIGK
jgi:phospholipid/cholesterol/gamma-HCH transport system ATP-binding protein